MYSKSSPAHLAECVNTIVDEFMERTDGWEFEDQVAELGAKGNPEMLLALTTKREA